MNPTGETPAPVVAATTKEAATAAGQALAASGPLTKLVIAIHGIGDQYRFATIRSVVTRFGRYFDFPAAVPLGSFHAPAGSLQAFHFRPPPSIPNNLGDIGFAEAYWADIPRAIQTAGYTLEESKAWARTVVERVRARYGQYNQQGTDRLNLQTKDFRDAAFVLQEMIETIHLIGNLLFLAEKAGLPKFNLDEMLTAYLGDVQLVADFEGERFKILTQLREVIDSLWTQLSAQQSKPEIYLVAHSEGTVVAFMCLLQAMSLPTTGEVAPPARPEWIDYVRGFMTIGSPIDKHLILWPDIWRAFYTPGKLPKPIKWRNYYDYGDPVGFDLDTARDWMSEPDHPWSPAFEFQPEHDFGFSRYVLPGEAHNEYWNDGGVFGHFIQTVMGVPAVGGRNFAPPPPSHWWARVASYFIPYIFGFLLLYTGTYFLYKSLHGYVAPSVTQAATSSSSVSDQDNAYLIRWWHQYRRASDK